MMNIDYSINSEIDKAFPYIISLNKELEEKKKTEEEKKNQSELEKQKQGKNASLSKIIKYYFSFQKEVQQNNIQKDEVHLDTNKKYIKSSYLTKDGYKFSIKFNRIVNDDINNPCYIYEVYVDIKYDKEIIRKQLYQTFFDKDLAKKHYINISGKFKYLKRRDIVEIIFKNLEEKLNSN